MNDFIMRYRQHKVLAIRVDHGETHFFMVVLTVYWLMLNVAEGVMHPAHIPLEPKT